MSSPENALVQADKSKIDDGHPSGQNDWGVAALFNMITPHFFEYHRYSSSIRIEDVQNRVRPRFFDQVGHETMYASIANKHFFTKSCHREAYQYYENKVF